MAAPRVQRNPPPALSHSFRQPLHPLARGLGEAVRQEGGRNVDALLVDRMIHLGLHVRVHAHGAVAHGLRRIARCLGRHDQIRFAMDEQDRRAQSADGWGLLA